MLRHLAVALCTPRCCRQASTISFPVSPGARVTVHASGDAAVTVVRGAHDAVAAEWDAADSDGASPPPPAVTATQEGDDVTITVPAGAARRGLTLAIPARYTSVAATTRGAPFSLERLTEAALDVDSGGGPIAIDGARGSRVALASRGGAVRVAGELVADDLRVTSDGGDVTAAKLTARLGAVSTGGGAVAVGALYGDRVALATGGGAVRVGTLHCAAGAAVIDSAGGPVTLDGVDGRAAVSTGGGALAAHVLARAARVAARTRGGDADVRVDGDVLAAAGGARVDGAPVSAAALPVAGTVALVAPPAVSAAAAADLLERDLAAGGGDDGSQSMCHSAVAPADAPLPADAGGGGRRGGGGRLRDAAPAPPIILVDAGPGGRVWLDQASWFDAAMARAAGGRREAGGRDK